MYYIVNEIQVTAEGCTETSAYFTDINVAKQDFHT